MSLRASVVPTGLLLVAATAATAATAASTATDASIPFADHHGINDWQADGTRGIWVQSSDRSWYYGTFLGPCQDLDFANGIGFVTEPSGEFNRWSYVVVRHWPPCHFKSFVASDPPPSVTAAKAAREARAAARAAAKAAKAATSDSAATSAKSAEQAPAVPQQ